MISADSTRIGKMVRYHELQAAKRKVSSKLRSQARFFITRVDEILTPGSGHWAETLYPDRGELRQEIMFNKDPFRLAQEAGRVMDTQNLLDLGKERDVRRHEEELRDRGQKIQTTRRNYLEIQGRVEKIKAGRHAPKYEAVLSVRTYFRDKYFGDEVGPLVRVNMLQRKVQAGLGSGTKVKAPGQEETPGETALQNMAESNSPVQKSIRSIEDLEAAERTTARELEAATWALYLHVAAGGFHPAGPAKHEFGGQEIPCQPAAVMRN